MAEKPPIGVREVTRIGLLLTTTCGALPHRKDAVSNAAVCL
jgi:hypothetical protein